MLLAGILVAGFVFYRMLAAEGEGRQVETKVAAVPAPAAQATQAAPAAGKQQSSGIDWTDALERHAEPAPATDAPFTLADGAQLTLTDFRGRGVVLNLWATWCAPCVREMPSLDRLQAAVAEHGIDVVAVSSDRGGAHAVDVFMQTHKLTNLKIYLDPAGKFTRSIEGRGLPRTYIIDSQGKVAASLVGAAEWDAPELVAAVLELAR